MYLMVAVGMHSRFDYFKPLMLCLQKVWKKIFFWPPFYIFDFFEENELKALYFFLLWQKKGLLSIDLYLRFRPELICKNLPDMLSC